MLAIDDAASAATEYEALNGGDGDAAVADVTVIIPASDGAVGVTVSQTAVTAVEGGSAGTFTVVLSKVPSNNVVVSVTEASADVTLSATSLTFTPANWNTPQTVYVTAVDDTVVEVQETVTLVLAIDDAASAATEYEALNSGDGDAAVADVTVTIPANNT